MPRKIDQMASPKFRIGPDRPLRLVSSPTNVMVPTEKFDDAFQTPSP